MPKLIIATARRHRGAGGGHSTRIEKDIARLKGITTLGPNDQWRIKRLLEQIKEDDRDYKEHLVAVLNSIDVDYHDTKEA